MKLESSSTLDDNAKMTILIFCLALISIVASFNPQWHLWGLDSPKIFPVWIRLLLLAFLMLLVIPKTGARIEKAFSNQLISLNRTQLSILYAFLSAVLTVLFVILSSQNHFLGDGYNIQGNIVAGRYLSPTEPLDYLVHQLIYGLIGKTDRAAYLSYAICSYACGIAFLICLFATIHNKSKLILSMGVIACFTAIQFFFGYMENYSFSFVMIFFYSLLAVRDLNKNRLSLSTAVLLLIACAFQVSCVVLIPSLLYLATMKYNARQRITVLVIAPVMGLLILAAYLLYSSYIPIWGIIVPLLRTSDNPYSLFSGQHTRDVINILLLNYPLLLVVLLLRYLRQRIIALFYLLLIGPALLYVILIDPKLGAFRDWDLLSIASAPLLAFLINSLLIEKGAEKRWNCSIFIALGIFGILHTGGWIVQNSSQARGYPVVREEVKRDIHFSSSYLSGFRNKSWALLARDAGDYDEMLRAGFERYYGDPSDYYNTCQLAEALMVLGHNDKAIEIIQQNWAKFKGEPYSASKLSETMMNMGKLSEAEQICQGFLSTGQQDTLVYSKLANIKRLQGQIDSCYYYLDKSYSIDPNRPLEMQFQFYLECFSNGYDSLTLSGAKRLLPQLPDKLKGKAVILIDNLENGNKASIDSLRSVIKAIFKKPPTQ